MLGGATGVRPGRVVVLGAGIVGSGAAQVSSGLGAEVVVVDQDLDRLRTLQEARLSNVATLAASSLGIKAAVLQAGLVIGAVYISGARTPAPSRPGDGRTDEGWKRYSRCGRGLTAVAWKLPVLPLWRSNLRGSGHHPLLRQERSGRWSRSPLPGPYPTLLYL